MVIWPIRITIDQLHYLAYHQMSLNMSLCFALKTIPGLMIINLDSSLHIPLIFIFMPLQNLLNISKVDPPQYTWCSDCIFNHCNHTPVYNWHSDCNHVNCQTLSSHNYEINSFLLYLSFHEDRCYLLAPHL